MRRIAQLRSEQVVDAQEQGDTIDHSRRRTYTVGRAGAYSYGEHLLRHIEATESGGLGRYINAHRSLECIPF